MSRKTYYYILACGLSVIFVYAVLCIFVLQRQGVPTMHIMSYKDVFALLIVIYEVLHAGRPFRIVGYCLFPLAVIGYLFRIMHWPLSSILFSGSLLGILLVLLIGAFMQKGMLRLEKILILIYPAFHFTWMLMMYYGDQEFWWNTDLVIIGITSVLLWLRIAFVKPKV